MSVCVSVLCVNRTQNGRCLLKNKIKKIKKECVLAFSQLHMLTVCVNQLTQVLLRGCRPLTLLVFVKCSGLLFVSQQKQVAVTAVCSFLNMNQLVFICCLFPLCTGMI